MSCLASACPDASLRERVWDAAEVPESIPLSPLLPLGNEMRSDVDSSPPPLSLSLALCVSLSLSRFVVLFISLFLSPSFFNFGGVESFPHCPFELGCELLDCSIHLVCSECVQACAKEHKAVSRTECSCQICGYIFSVMIHSEW